MKTGKLSIAVFSVIFITCLAFTQSAAQVAGNIDGSQDGAVNLSDAVTALRVCAGMSPAGVAIAAEVNGDQAIGLAEAIYALQTVAGLRGGILVRSSDLQ